MRAVFQKIYHNPKNAKALHWGKLITITGGGQVLLQVISLISGILVIRLLPTKEYALYTLVNTMLGTITVLADGGITLGVMAQGGKVWQDPQKLGKVIVTGLNLRKKFAIVTLAIAIPALFYLLVHHGASWLMTLLIIMSLVPAFYAALSDTLLEIAPKLKQDILPLQKNALFATTGRLVISAITLFVFPLAFIAILAGGLPRIWANIQLKKVSVRYVDFNQSRSPEVQKEILNFVKRILPGAIYYCLSGQITIWLISILGTTTSVAQIGALDRLSVFIGFFSILFNTLITPRYARLTFNSKQLLSYYLKIQAGLLFFGGCVVMSVWLFSSQLLWILGTNYSSLQNELVLNITGTVVGLIAGLSFSIYTSRGWAINPVISIPINITAIVVGVVLFDISSLHGVLLFNIFLAIIQALINSSFGCIKIMNSRSIAA